jgi:N-acyl homoserine lactone hydrolase
VLVETSAGKVLITGFCCTRDNFDDSGAAAWHSSRQPDVIPPGIHMDFQMAYDSTLRVKQLADIVLPMHDPMLYSTRRVP